MVNSQQNRNKMQFFFLFFHHSRFCPLDAQQIYGGNCICIVQHGTNMPTYLYLYMFVVVPAPPFNRHASIPSAGRLWYFLHSCINFEFNFQLSVLFHLFFHFLAWNKRSLRAAQIEWRIGITAATPIRVIRSNNNALQWQQDRWR